MKTITKKQIVHDIALKRGMDPKEVQRIIQEFLDSVTENLSEGNRFEFRDFGIFEVVLRKAKVGRSPKSPEKPIPIPPTRVVKFTPGKKMKRIVEG